MTGIEQFRYDGKRALVVGGATGMGAAAAKIVGDLGAEVINLDYAPVEARARPRNPGRPSRPGVDRQRARAGRRAD